MERLAQAFAFAKEHITATHWAALAVGVWTRLGRTGDRLRVYRLLESLQKCVWRARVSARRGCAT
jgi:hypothetical protein